MDSYRLELISLLLGGSFILYLVRHGKTDWNHIGKIQGHMDIPLNEVGRKQAKRLAQSLRNSGVSKIYSSDLQRAYETAVFIADELNVSEIITCPLLRERSFGHFEGLSLEQLLEKIPDYETNWDDTNNSLIEPLEEVRKRAVLRLEEIVNEAKHENVLVVSHGAFISAFLYDITKGKEGPGITTISNTSYSILSYENNLSWKIETLNSDQHLLESIVKF